MLLIMFLQSERLQNMTAYSSVRHGRGRSQRRGESRRTGQWKLAYADFLTALMAFFLLMWLSTGSSQAERSAIAAYFSGTHIPGNTLVHRQTDLEAILSAEITTTPALSAFAHQISLTAEPAGLRIDLTDADANSLFASGASTLSPKGLGIVSNIGHILLPMPLDIHIEGHTDAFKTAPGTPTNWDISSARASSALKALQLTGIAPDRFKSVTGLAATKPLLPNQPHAPINRRISIVLEFSE